MNFNNLEKYNNPEDIIEYGNLLVYLFPSIVKFVFRYRGNNYCINEKQYAKIHSKKNIIYFYYKPYKSYLFEYRFTVFDNEYDPHIRICKYINNRLIYIDAVIYSGRIFDPKYYFSESKRKEIFNYYINNVEKEFKSHSLLYRL